MSRRTQLIVFGVLVAMLAAVLYYQWSRAADSGFAAAVAAPPTAGAARRSPVQQLPAVPPVRLDALAAARAEPAPPAAGRNLFQFRPKLPPAQAAGGPGASVPAVNLPPPPPPPPPPIPYKFIGIVQAPDKKIAVLTDASTRDVFYGREGEVIDGRYRILRIGVESIEMAYIDGRGRQTIRLTGS